MRDWEIGFVSTPSSFMSWIRSAVNFADNSASLLLVISNGSLAFRFYMSQINLSCDPTMGVCLRISPASISFVFIRMIDAPTRVSPCRIDVSMGDGPRYLERPTSFKEYYLGSSEGWMLNIPRGKASWTRFGI